MNTRIALATVILLASGAAAAADAFTELDTDGNGLLSADEASKMPGLIDQWKSLDVNEDGNLDAKEFTASVTGRETVEVQKAEDGAR